MSVGIYVNLPPDSFQETKKNIQIRILQHIRCKTCGRTRRQPEEKLVREPASPRRDYKNKKIEIGIKSSNNFGEFEGSNSRE